MLADARCERTPGQMLILIGDKNFRGQDFETELTALEATIMRTRRKDEQGRGPHLAPIRQRIESIFQTCKDILTLERHGPPHPRQPPRPPVRQVRRARCCRIAQPPARPPQPQHHLLHRITRGTTHPVHRLNSWNYSSSKPHRQWATPEPPFLCALSRLVPTPPPLPPRRDPRRSRSRRRAGW